jgi:hypothetical protein
MDRKKITVSVVGPEDQLRSFVELCKTIEWLGEVGASRTVKIDVDGDGAACLRFGFGALDHSAVEPAPDTNGGDEIRVTGIGG